MPFAGSGVAAPIMAAKQGMKDIAFTQVSDQAKPVIQFVKGAITGQGSGLQAPTTQSNAGPMQGAVTKVQQAAGQAMTLGKSEFWAAGASTGVVGGAGAGGVGETVAKTLSGGGLGGGMGDGASAAMQSASGMMSGSASQGLASAHSMLGGGGGSLGSAAAMAGSSLGLGGSGQGSAGPSSIGSSLAKAGIGSVMNSTLPEVTPGQQPTAPQFTALPQIPSIERLQAAASQLGSMAMAAAKSEVNKATGGLASQIPGMGGDSDSGTSQPVSQFAGKGPVASYQADS